MRNGEDVILPSEGSAGAAVWGLLHAQCAANLIQLNLVPVERRAVRKQYTSAWKCSGYIIM
jgi:hypothetical protein